jgi:hypothetical protein
MSKRGVAGGYRLKRAPQQITLAEIIRHIEGPLAPVSCVSEKYYEKCSCPDESRCAIRSVMKEVRDSIVQVMEATTLGSSRRSRPQTGTAAAQPVRLRSDLLSACASAKFRYSIRVTAARHISNIALIGFMGTGKTTVGRLGAEQLKFELLDTDALIEQRSGKKITEIFAQSGEPPSVN